MLGGIFWKSANYVTQCGGYWEVVRNLELEKQIKENNPKNLTLAALHNQVFPVQPKIWIQTEKEPDESFTYSQNSVAGVVAFAAALQLDDVFALSNSTQDSEF